MIQKTSKAAQSIENAGSVAHQKHYEGAEGRREGGKRGERGGKEGGERGERGGRGGKEGGERGERARGGDMKGGQQRLITASRGVSIKDLHRTDEFAQLLSVTNCGDVGVLFCSFASCYELKQ